MDDKVGSCLGAGNHRDGGGGLIGLLKNGDKIRIDIPGHLLEVDLTQSEIENRRAGLKPFTPRIKTGYLKRYAQFVQNAGAGAVLD